VCDHPCESDCRRGEVDEAVSIRQVKWYATEHDDGAWKKRGYRKASTGKRVAVVGAGPAGLTAAYYLAKSGHDVTVFEAQAQPGGQLRVGIPDFRLPREVVEQEIEQIASVGVDVRCDTRVESVTALREEGYEAVLVAVGTHQGVRLPIPGNDLPDVLVSTDFLRSANLGEPVSVGECVVVLGGGSVAFDCAAWARRLGAKQVTLACLEPREAMRATAEDVEQALADGCTVENTCTFDEIESRDGRVTSVRFRRVASCTFDENGTPDLCVEQGSDFAVPADTVIFAVGQRPALSPEFGVGLGWGNRVTVTGEGGVRTGTPGVFAAGDAATGTLSVVNAIAAGRRAASAIDRYLGGDGVIDESLASLEATNPCIGREEGFVPRGRCEGESDEAARCLQCDLRLEIAPEKFWGEYETGKRQPAGA
jgi:formate dehydrogenase beta subunit